MAEECIFCRIANGTAPSYKIYEDRDYVAILDIFPETRGQTLVIPKRHMDSYVFNLTDKEIDGLMVVIKNVAALLKKGLKADRINLAFEGVQVPHLHAKLFPDYIFTKNGPKASDDQLRKLQRQITGK